MKISYLKFLIILFPLFDLRSQTISGKVQTIYGQPITAANIVTIDSSNLNLIKEYAITKNGNYFLRLTKNYKVLIIEVTSFGFKKQSVVINNYDSSKDYVHDFILIRDTIIQLKEVVVKGKIRPFKINGDTVSYTVSAYRNGTERKIQDIIKKLPGIEVNEKTGEIKYKGKSVETVKLDGEDLFSSNYAIGTKNINVDMVEQVQAIENYSDNPLLKSIESEDKVALNLTFKKKKTDYSGNIDFGSGILGTQTAYDISSNLLGISKSYKSFATVSYNNIGINNTPFDYFSYNPSIEQLNDEPLLAKKTIPDTYFNSEIDPDRNNINNSFFGSYNAAFRVGKKLSLKTNLYYLKDQIYSEQFFVSSNNINGQHFTTSDQYSINKKPTQYRADIDAKYNVSKTSLIEYTLIYKYENIATSNKVFQNNISNYNTELITNDDYFKQVITCTKKISEKKAIQFIARQSFNTVPQNFKFLPAILDSLIYSENNQGSGFKKNDINLQAIFLSSRSKNKFTTTLTYEFQDINFNSELKGKTGFNEQIINGFTNNFNYTINSLSSNTNYKLQLGKFRFNPSFNLAYLHQYLLDKRLNISYDSSNIILQPSFSASFKINNYSAFIVSTAYTQKPFSEEYFVANPVYISNRLTQSNEVSLHIQKSKNLSFTFLINNLYKQFQLTIGANYAVNNGNFFSNLLIQQNSTQAFYFYLPEHNKVLSLNFMIEKYIPFLQGTIRLKNNYTNINYKNIVNNSLLRNNVTQTLTSELFFKTAFDLKINFENIIKHHFADSKSDGGFQFLNQAINDNFQVIINPQKRLFVLLSTDFYLPNTSYTKEKYFFFDFSLNYQSKNKIYDFRFKAKNITNNKTLNQFDTNDYSTTNFQANLLPRLIMISVSRNF